MSSIRLAQNADFSNSGLGMLMPTSGVQVFSYFGRSLEASLKNYAPGGIDLTSFVSQDGTLTINENSVDCQSVSPRASFTTAVAESSEITLLVAGMPNGAFSSTFSSPYLVGNLTRSASANDLMTGIGIRLSHLGNVVAELGNGEAQAVKTLTLATNLSNPHFYALVLSGGMITLYNMTDGTSVSGADDRVSKAYSATTIRFGSSGNASLRQGASRLFWGDVVSRGLSAAEVKATYQQVKRGLASRGVTV